MARIVIDIPDYMLNQIMIGCPFKLPSQFVTETYKIIRNGKILPKGHGEMVYREDVCNELRYMDNNGFITRRVYHVIEDIEKNVQTIIEADKTNKRMGG